LPYRRFFIALFSQHLLPRKLIGIGSIRQFNILCRSCDICDTGQCKVIFLAALVPASVQEILSIIEGDLRPAEVNRYLCFNPCCPDADFIDNQPLSAAVRPERIQRTETVLFGFVINIFTSVRNYGNSPCLVT